MISFCFMEHYFTLVTEVTSNYTMHSVRDTHIYCCGFTSVSNIQLKKALRDGSGLNHSWNIWEQASCTLMKRLISISFLPLSSHTRHRHLKDAGPSVAHEQVAVNYRFLLEEARFSHHWQNWNNHTSLSHGDQAAVKDVCGWECLHLTLYGHIRAKKKLTANYLFEHFIYSETI